MSQTSRLRALEAEGLLHPRADAVSAELFAHGGFFLAADKVQVKYEMLRAHLLDGASVTAAAAAVPVSSSSANPVANASSRGSSCGVHGGRAAPSSAAANTGSALGQAISPATPRRANRAAIRLSGGAPVVSTCARNVS